MFITEATCDKSLKVSDDLESSVLCFSDCVLLVHEILFSFMHLCFDQLMKESGSFKKLDKLNTKINVINEVKNFFFFM